MIYFFYMERDQYYRTKNSKTTFKLVEVNLKTFESQIVLSKEYDLMDRNTPTGEMVPMDMRFIPQISEKNYVFKSDLNKDNLEILELGRAD